MSASGRERQCRCLEGLRGSLFNLKSSPRTFIFGRDRSEAHSFTEVMGKLRCSKTLMELCPTIPGGADYGNIRPFHLFSISLLKPQQSSRPMVNP